MAYYDMILKEFCFSEAYFVNGTDFNISPLTYNGEVKKLTWLQGTDVKIRDIQVVGTSNVIQYQSLKTFGWELRVW